MTEQEAVNLAHLWRAGKLIGGDPYEVCDVLLGMLYRIDTMQKDAERYRWFKSALENNEVIAYEIVDDILFEESMDSLIDNAMKGQNGSTET